MPVSPSQMRGVVHAIAFGEQPALLAKMGTRNVSGAASLAITNAGWWDDPNVVGLCYAPKVRRGRVEELSLQVLVRTKRPRHRVPARRQIPPFIALSDLGLRGKVATDVREVGTSQLDVLAGSERPVRPGFSIGHLLGGSGTLACAVRSLYSNERLGLSCAHVIARYGRAVPGERVLVPAVEQLSFPEQQFEAQFGGLERIAPIGIGFDKAPFNVDAATVRPDNPAALDNQVARINIRPSAVRDVVPIGLMVRKVGATTEETHGAVETLFSVVSLPFRDARGQPREVWFTDMVGITHFSRPGDSGALVLDSSGAAVGLHMGSFNGLSVCMPIRRVLESLECELDTSPAPTAPASPPVV